jgi:hypothetical protein
VTIYNHRATNSLLKILIDYVPFGMPSFRPGKNCMCREKSGSRDFFAKPGGKPIQN